MTHSVSFIEYIHGLCNGNRLASTKGLMKELNGFGTASPSWLCVHSLLLSDRATKCWATLIAEFSFMVPLSQETSRYL